MNVYIVGGGYDYCQMFEDAGWKVVQELAQADLVQFTGGSDVSPQLYGEVRHMSTHCDSARDLEEVGIFLECQRNLMPMAGICRGGQFLNVMCGGKLHQDVHCHAIGGTHVIRDVNTADMIDVSSTHHQMMKAGVGGDVLATGVQTSHGFVFHLPESEDSRVQVEVVLYGSQSVLCYQPHPEFNADWNEANRAYYFELINDLVEGV